MGTNPPGVRPDKATIHCSNCGGEYRCKHMNIPPWARTSVECSDCSSTGIVLHNRFSYVAGTAGAVSVEELSETQTA